MKNKAAAWKLKTLWQKASRELSSEDVRIWLAKCYGALIGTLETTGDIAYFTQVIERELERMIKINQITVER